MNPPTREFPPGGGDATGNRPSALKVHKDSRKIRKPAVAPPSHHHPPPREDRKPVIIYDIEPRVIHTTAKDFKKVVQLLTGMPTARRAGAGGSSPPPATRPIKNQEIITGTTAVEMGRVPGILPPPSLPPISPGLFFSAPLDPYNMPADLGPLDPYMMGYQSTVSSSDPTLSPSPSSSSADLSNPFFEI